MNQKLPQEPVRNTRIAIDIMTARIREDRDFSTSRVMEYANDRGAGPEAVISGLINLNAALLQILMEKYGQDRLQVLQALGTFLANAEE